MIPTTDQLARKFDSMRDRMVELEKWWAVAIGNAYARPRHGKGEGPRSSTQRCGRCKGTGELVTSEGSDPVVCSDCAGDGSVPVTEDVANELVATERYRDLLEKAAKKANEAAKAMDAMQDYVARALRQLDPPSSIEPADVKLRPHPAGVMDRLRAQAAQNRRTRRAEKSGDYSEVM